MGHVPSGFNVGGVVRAADEEHRVSTPLELFFDLCFVVAVAQAAAGLHDLLVERRFADAVIGFVALFFAVWWAWVNVVWFSTGHDSDDVVHRVLTLVQMAGALILAAGVHDAMFDLNLTTTTVGYAVMRLGLVPLWLRVGRDRPDQRGRAYRFALTIVVLQILWIARLALPDDRSLTLATFAVGVALELLAPMWAERRAARQQFNGGHLAERFGLFTIIVLGEVVLSSTVAVREAVDVEGATVKLLVVAISGLVIAFAVWWAYFARNDVPAFDRFNGAFVWGYAHFPIFGGLAAFGAGVHVAIGAVVGPGEHVPSQRLAALALTIPLAVGAAGFATVVATSGSRNERPVAGILLATSALLVVIGLTLPVKPAIVVTAILIVAGTIAQAVLGRRTFTSAATA
jgi:low temperature requirement protein LtrA